MLEVEGLTMTFKIAVVISVLNCAALAVACGSDDEKSGGKGSVTGGSGGSVTGGSGGSGGSVTGGSGGSGGSVTGDSGASDAAPDATDAAVEADAGVADAADAACSVSALHFGAAGHTITVPSAASLDFGSAATLELWLYEDAPPDGGVPAAGTLFNKWTFAQEDKYLGVAAGNVLNIYLHTSVGLPVGVVSTATLGAGKWTHVAFVHDATSVRGYIDGSKVSEVIGAAVVANAAGPVQIGHVSRDYQSPPVIGYYSEMRLSKVARYVANFTPALHLVSDADTQAFWKFDEGTGAVANDTSGNAHTGTITGATWAPAPCR